MAVELVLLELEQLRGGDEVALVVGVPEAAIGAHAQARGAAHAVREQLEFAVGPSTRTAQPLKPPQVPMTLPPPMYAVPLPSCTRFSVK